MITITERICAPLLVRFVFESVLDYVLVGDIDGRLACYTRGDSRWAVAWCDRAPAGIACITNLDDGRYKGSQCLYWLEVLPPFQAQGIGKALLAWASAQTEGNSLAIAVTPTSAPFYRRHLTDWTEPTPNTFLKGGFQYTTRESLQRDQLAILLPAIHAGNAPAHRERRTV
jgi:GNAT superfamily N-acetyltransferase